MKLILTKKVAIDRTEQYSYLLLLSFWDLKEGESKGGREDWLFNDETFGGTTGGEDWVFDVVVFDGGTGAAAGAAAVRTETVDLPFDLARRDGGISSTELLADYSPKNISQNSVNHSPNNSITKFTSSPMVAQLDSTRRRKREKRANSNRFHNISQ